MPTATRTATYTTFPSVFMPFISVRVMATVSGTARASSTTSPRNRFSTKPVTFRLAAVVAGVLLLVGLYQLRLRQAAARLSARLEERLAERERIARDLHDTLLQGFQGLILRFHDAMMDIPEREPARQLMETALDRADEVMAEGRDRVVSLHPSFDRYAATWRKLWPGPATRLRTAAKSGFL